MRAYIDPETGQLTTPPEDGQPVAVPAPQAGLSTSGERLVQVPVTGPVPGVIIRLQGRFRSSLTATVGPDGKARIRHETPCPDAAASKR